MNYYNIILQYSAVNLDITDFINNCESISSLNDGIVVYMKVFIFETRDKYECLFNDRKLNKHSYGGDSIFNPWGKSGVLPKNY